MIPDGWKISKIGDVADIKVGRDLDETAYSKAKSGDYKFPVYSNTVEEHDAYGYYNFPEYPKGSLTIVGRGIGLGTAFARNTDFGAIGRLLVLLPQNKSFDAHYLASFINNRLQIHYESSGIPQLPGKTLANYQVILPPFPEQRRIAEILSTWDKAIEATEKLIANSEAQKKALMQQLLTGKKRLPGFDENPQTVSLTTIAKVSTGNSNKQDSLEKGKYLFFDRSTEIRKSNQYLFDAEAIIVGGEGQEFIPKYYEGKFDLHQRAYCVHDFEEMYGKYIYYSMHYNRKFLRRFAVGSTVPSLRMDCFEKVPIRLIAPAEQRVIGNLIWSRDVEIAKLKIKLEHLKSEKKALMQQLLTGKRRVKIEEEDKNA